MVVHVQMVYSVQMRRCDDGSVGADDSSPCHERGVCRKRILRIILYVVNLYYRIIQCIICAERLSAKNLSLNADLLRS